MVMRNDRHPSSSGEGVVNGGHHARAAADLTPKTVIGPISSLSAKGRARRFGEGQFQALFASIAADQIERGADRGVATPT